MTSLLTLAVLLTALWIWAMFERGRRAVFMQEWQHVPLIGAITCVVMALGLWMR